MAPASTKRMRDGGVANTTQGSMSLPRGDARTLCTTMSTYVLWWQVWQVSKERQVGEQVGRIARSIREVCVHKEYVHLAWWFGWRFKVGF